MSEQEEEQKEPLEEKFARLREEGLTDPEIVRLVLEENLKTDINELVRITGMKKLDIGRIKGTASRLAKRRRAKERLAPKEPPTPYKGPVDATIVLRQILARHPDIPPKVVEEVLSWAEYGPIHPTQLVYLLQSMRGIQSTTANIVAQKYSLALQKAQQQGKLQIPPPMFSPQFQQTQWGAPFPMSFQQPQPQMFPFQMQPLARPPSPVSPIAPTTQPSPFAPPFQYPPYWQPPQDVGSVVKEQVEDMKKYVDTKLEALRPKEEQYVEMREPLRTPEGRVIVDDQGRPIVRTVRTPVSQASQMMGGDPELRALEKLKTMKEIFKPEKELTPEKIREIVRQEVPKKTEPEVKPVTPEEVQKAASEAAAGAVQKFIQVHQKEEASERRHRELLNAIRTSATEKVVEGYKSDAYRFLGQGMQEMARVMEKKEPVKLVVEGVKTLVGTAPPPKEVEEGAKEGVVSQLRPEWVAQE